MRVEKFLRTFQMALDSRGDEKMLILSLGNATAHTLLTPHRHHTASFSKSRAVNTKRFTIYCQLSSGFRLTCISER